MLRRVILQLFECHPVLANEEEKQKKRKTNHNDAIQIIALCKRKKCLTIWLRNENAIIGWIFRIRWLHNRRQQANKKCSTHCVRRLSAREQEREKERKREEEKKRTVACGNLQIDTYPSLWCDSRFLCMHAFQSHSVCSHFNRNYFLTLHCNWILRPENIVLFAFGFMTLFICFIIFLSPFLSLCHRSLAYSSQCWKRNRAQYFRQ